MSCVTDLFLLTDTSFDPDNSAAHKDTFAQVQAWLAQATKGQQLKRLDTNAEAQGGSHMMQASVWCGAFNYLPLAAFLAFLVTQDWRPAHTVQVLYQDDEDIGFTLVTITHAA